MREDTIDSIYLYTGTERLTRNRGGGGYGKQDCSYLLFFVGYRGEQAWCVVQDTLYDVLYPCYTTPILLSLCL